MRRTLLLDGRIIFGVFLVMHCSTIIVVPSPSARHTFTDQALAVCGLWPNRSGLQSQRAVGQGEFAVRGAASQIPRLESFGASMCILCVVWDSERKVGLLAHIDAISGSNPSSYARMLEGLQR